MVYLLRELKIKELSPDQKTKPIDEALMEIHKVHIQFVIFELLIADKSLIVIKGISKGIIVLDEVCRKVLMVGRLKIAVVLRDEHFKVVSNEVSYVLDGKLLLCK